MRMGFLKSIVVLAALIALAVVPVVEANYMLGHPYVGSGSQPPTARRWILSAFYEGREMPTDRIRYQNRYYIGGSQGRAWRNSLLLDKTSEELPAMMPLQTGTRCLGCEIGAYSLLGPAERRGRYYYSSTQIAGRSKFIYTGGSGASTQLSSYQLLRQNRNVNRMFGKNALLGKNVVQASRLNLQGEDLEMLHAEASELLDDYTLKSGRRCLSCMYEVGKRLGRYYYATPEIKNVRSFVPLQ